MKTEMESIESVLDRVPPGRYTVDELLAASGLDWDRGVLARQLMGNRHLRNLEVVDDGPRKVFIVLQNVKEHATLSAGASVDHGVGVETTQEHENRAADRGCCVSSCSTLRFVVCILVSTHLW